MESLSAWSASQEQKKRQTVSLDGSDLSVRIKRLLIESVTEQRGEGTRNRRKYPLPYRLSSLKYTVIETPKKMRYDTTIS